jgi:hypothetical protein
MQFKYPELLYALFLLIIPILIHLFQLRKFEKVPFTNVKFLKKVELQTRKSSKLKKFLVLLSRLLFLTFLILAFAQPYFSNYKKGQKIQTIVYLDNSLSMQAKKGSISLLENAKQKIIKEINEKNINISLLTNNNFYKNLDKKELKNTILSIKYYPINKTLDAVLQKANFLFEKKQNVKRNFVLISDFQNQTIKKIDSSINYTFIPLKANKTINYSIDSLYIEKQTADKLIVKINTKSSDLTDNSISYSLYDNHKLLGKTSVSYKEKTQQNSQFTITNTQKLNGKISTTDNQLQFDNTLYFSIDKPKKIKVMGIGKSNDFLSKIYTKDHFNFISVNQNQIDFNELKKQNTVILNELEKINLPLQKILIDFVKNGGHLAIIPSFKIDLNNYNSLFNSLKIGKVNSINQKEIRINKINFSHPILKGVFEKNIDNFQYPSVKIYYDSNLKNDSGILNFENQANFISQINYNKGKIFWFASPLNTKYSNFKNSPLIVPVFYNIGSQSYNISKLYYLIGNENHIDIQTNIKNDNVLKIQEKGNPENSFIPLQQIFNDKVQLNLKIFPLKAGFYEIRNQDTVLKNIAFNYSREENKFNQSNLDYLKKYKNIKLSDTITSAFEQIYLESQTNNYWRFMLLFALIFLILEMIIIKFWKN